jgi:hypothetical protein
MRVSIIVPDNIVYVDGVPAPVDCSDLSVDTHAVQWYDDFGEVEYNNELDEETMTVYREPNLVLTDFEPYRPYVEEWLISHNREVEERRKKEEEVAAQNKATQDMIDESKRAEKEAMEKAANQPTPIDIVFEHENRIRKLEGRREITIEELTKYVWERIEPCD